MRIIKRETRYRGQMFELLDIEVEDASGASERRELAVRVDSVGIIPIFDNGDLLLIREYALGADATVLTLPGGKIEPHEDPQDRARIELLEETGFESPELTKFISMHSDPINCLKRSIHFFVGPRPCGRI